MDLWHGWRSAEVDRLDRGGFEPWLAGFFRDLGYVVTPGRDLVIEKGGRRTAVHLKLGRRRAGVGDVQKAVLGSVRSGAEGTLLVTNRDIGYRARQVAGITGVDLWDRDVLLAKLSARSV